MAPMGAPWAPLGAHGRPMGPMSLILLQNDNVSYSITKRQCLLFYYKTTKDLAAWMAVRVPDH